MKNQFNHLYIFCTFRGQLVLLIAFIIINLFNVGIYAFTEGSNAFGEYVGFTIKMQENDPTFVPDQVFQHKAYQLDQFYKEKAAIEGKTLPTNPISWQKGSINANSNQNTLEPINKPAFLVYESNDVVPIKTLYPIIKKDLDFQGGEKLKTLIRNLDLIETKYTQKNTNNYDNYDNFLQDMNNLFVDYKIATINDYENIRLAKINGLTESHVYFNEHLLMLYKCSQGNPILLHALATYNTNQMLFTLFNDPEISINLDAVKLKMYSDFFFQYQKELKNNL